MRHVGTIVRPEKPEIEEATWKRVLKEHPNLFPIRSLQIVNPFTQELDTLDQPGELASIDDDDGNRVGALRWCSRGEGIDVFGDLAKVTQTAKEIAEDIGGEFDTNP